jgi:hypothetical protein
MIIWIMDCSGDRTYYLCVRVEDANTAKEELCDKLL